MEWLPGAGDVVYVTSAASVQFGPHPFLFRVIRVLELDTYQGWVWLEGYQLNSAWDAVERRRIFVQPAGLQKLDPADQPKRRTGAAPRGAAPQEGSARRDVGKR